MSGKLLAVVLVALILVGAASIFSWIDKFKYSLTRETEERP